MHPILMRIPLPSWRLPWLGELHPLPLHSYGVMLGISLVLGWFLSLRLAERTGLPKEEMGNCFVVAAIMSIVMSRLLYVLTNPSEFHSLGDLFAVWRGGLVAYGGFLGGFLGSVLYLRRERLPLWPWADAATPALALGLACTRIGCYLFGCDFGKPLPEHAPTWLKSLGTFPHWPEGTVPTGSGSPAWAQHVQQRGLSPDALASLPVHPTQLYELLVGVLLFVLVMAVAKRQTFRGQLFLLFIFMYGFLRFLLELFRDDLERGELGPRFSEHALLPVALLLFGAALAWGIAPSVRSVPFRRALQVASAIPSLVAYGLTTPAAFDMPATLQLSTSMWAGLLTALLAAIGYRLLAHAAELHPEEAMKVDLHEHELRAART